MNSGLRVLDAMTVRPVTTSPEVSVRDVSALMERYDVGSVIVKQGREVLGIVTESDLVRRAILEGCDMNRTRIGRVMSRDIVTVSPGLDIDDCVMLMRDANVRHLPVVDEGKLVGFITIKDILKVQPQLIDLIRDTFVLREEHRKPLRRIAEIEDD